MPRYKLLIEYDGAPFCGWQYQADQITVQGALTNAVKALTGEDVLVQGAGRTDAGVHATGQVAHIDLAKAWREDTVRDAVNAHLQAVGARIAIVQATAVDDGFDARFSATARHYVYRILNRRGPAALQKGQVWWVPKRLDADAMHEAAKVLLGRHDFTTFRSTQCQAESPVRTLDRLDVTRCDDLIEVKASARSFLHNQVRSMVGSLKRIGEGGWTVADLSEALAARDRSACGQVAPPDGLFLVKVDYPG